MVVHLSKLEELKDRFNMKYGFIYVRNKSVYVLMPNLVYFKKLLYNVFSSQTRKVWSFAHQGVVPPIKGCPPPIQKSIEKFAIL